MKISKKHNINLNKNKITKDNLREDNKNVIGLDQIKKQGAAFQTKTAKNNQIYFQRI